MKFPAFLAFPLLLGGILAGCSAPPSPPADPLLSPEQARAWLARTAGAQLVDVRTKEEYERGHLAGSRLIPVQELESRVPEIDANKPVLIYCRSGKRSHQAFELLRTKGFRDLRELAGGIEAWQAAGLPVEGAAPAAGR